MSGPLLLACLVSARASALPNPEAPTLEVTGQAGSVRAYYWVIAESADALPGAPSHYVGSFRNRMTALSPPAAVTLPADLGRGGKVTVRVKPVPGAARYHVLKTAQLPAPRAAVTVRKPGKGTLYYWVVAHNAWRRSPLAGPFRAEDTDTEQPANDIEVEPVPSATAYSYYVTRGPEPPLGRDYQGVAELVGPKVTHTGGAAHVPAGFPPTPETEPPAALGCYLLATTDGAPVEDTGQELSRFLPPSVNETESEPLAVPQGALGSARNPLNALMSLRPQAPPVLAPEPSFAWTGFYPLWLETQVESGGINHYQSPPAGGGNYKSSIGSMSLGLTSHTQSQYANLTGYLTTYGMGDSIWLAPLVNVHGGTRDQGDEGTEILRSHVDRVAKEVWLKLRREAGRGSVSLEVEGSLGEVGAGRVLVNASRAHRKGRVEYVENCVAYGLGTEWTPSMVGQWISFDVDSLPEPARGPWGELTLASGTRGPEGGVRQWYQIDQVMGPEQLRFRAITGWTSHCNLGFSRFIRDPETGKGPGTLYVNRLANLSLPPERAAAAEAGGYLIAPGTQVDDPYRKGDALQVEPLREAWRAGDTLVVAAGPQTTITHGWFVQFGNLMPQDVVQGLAVMNFSDRTANGPGIHVGGEPNTPGWQVGLQVTVPDSGMGDGIVINGSRVKSAAIAVPPDLPALRISGTGAPYLQGASVTNALEVRAPGGPVPAAFTAEGTRLRGQTRVEGELVLGDDGVLTGSPRTRGKVTLSGDGETTEFRVLFPRPFDREPVVHFRSNLLLRDALKAVDREGFTVLFESPPPAGSGNITLWWMAQQ